MIGRIMVLTLVTATQLPGALSAESGPTRHIVVLKKSAVAPPGASVVHGPPVSQVASEMGLRFGAKVHRSFERVIPAFVAQLDGRQAAELARDPRVDWVEPDQRVGITSTQSDPPSWGLDRIDQQQGLDSLYTSSEEGNGVHVFVVDTGIRSTHNDFGGRVETGVGFSAFDDAYGSEDCNGHGTHVAGIVAGATYGAAKRASLHSVRVLDCAGSGWNSDILAGVEWITTLKDSGELSAAPFVVNMSIGGGFTPSLERAVSASIERGITYVLAAGNSALDRCSSNLYRLPEVIIVGATTETDSVASYSNFGSCLDLYAPGSRIVSSYFRHDDESARMSGTSMAAPHVAGAAALLLSEDPLALPHEVEATLLLHSTTGVVTPSASHPSPALLFVGEPPPADEVADGEGDAGDEPPVNEDEPPPDPTVEEPPVVDDAPILFGDGFESADLDRWSQIAS